MNSDSELIKLLLEDGEFSDPNEATTSTSTTSVAALTSAKNTAASTSATSEGSRDYKIPSDTYSPRDRGLRETDCNVWSVRDLGYEVDGVQTPTSSLALRMMRTSTSTPPIYMPGDEDYDEDLRYLETSTPRLTQVSILDS